MRICQVAHSTAIVVQEYLIDAPVSVGDGFSFTGGNYTMQSIVFKVICKLMSSVHRARFSDK